MEGVPVGTPERLDTFRNEHAFLSNVVESPARFQGDVCATVEHALHAAKAFDLQKRAKVRDAETPGSA